MAVGAAVLVAISSRSRSSITLLPTSAELPGIAANNADPFKVAVPPETGRMGREACAAALSYSVVR